jgi:hypothetical protein
MAAGLGQCAAQFLEARVVFALNHASRELIGGEEGHWPEFSKKTYIY